jgi:AraC family transcriptional regulator, regulatory protein of adaptative response / DNA-3-methyladenine glycosylase II
MPVPNLKRYACLVAADPAHDGRFFVGVTTTGIYCLPSCRARKPKPENVRYFASCTAARQAGLRACKRCHPDDYERGADPVAATIAQVVAELRAEPAAFADGTALVARTGYRATRAVELFRFHFHATPAELLAQARYAALAARFARGAGGSIAAHAYAVGYESLSVVHAQMQQRAGMTPAAFRALFDPACRRFRLALPDGYPVTLLLQHLGRDRDSRSERVEGERVHLATWLAGGPARLLLTFRADAVDVDIVLAKALPAPVAPAAHQLVADMVGLTQNANGFARHIDKLGLQRLCKGREGWSGSRLPDVWDALVWAILGQQISLPFAFRLRRALLELAGEPVGDGLLAPPRPVAVAALTSEQLRQRSFSQAKADTLLGLARAIERRELDLEALRRGSAVAAARTLAAVRGLGPWSINYVLMRGLGFADCVPYGDTGLTTGLQCLFDLAERPDVAATRRLMQPFAPWRSLATAHLWQLKAESSVAAGV